MSNSVLIRGGHVLDPATGTNLERLDVLVRSGTVAAVGRDLRVGGDEGGGGAAEILDATGCFVSPGWIDLHAHVYEHATELGVDPDVHCLRRGVTTVVDAGSAGAMTFAGLRRFVAERSSTRVLALLHVAAHGLAGAGVADAGGGESDHLNALKVDKCVSCIRANRDMIVGVKVRLDRGITDGGRNEHEALLRALEAARDARVPLMVHRTNSGIPLSAASSTSSSSSFLSCPGSLRAGDIYTHCFHGQGGSILDPDTRRIDESVVRAQATGVLLDVGHGQGSFDWRVAEAAAAEDLWPDTISTDLHTGNVNGNAVKDLPNVMSKFLSLGMPLKKVIRAVTETPARAIRRQGQLGTLAPGAAGDATIFKVREVLPPGSLLSPDSFGSTRPLKRTLVPVAVCREGRVFTCRERD